jgi:protein ImuB
MFAALYSRVAAVAALVAVARAFTPRFQAIGPVVLLDVAGLSRLFGSAQEIGEQLFAQVLEGLSAGARSDGTRATDAARDGCAVALASTATAATLLALGRPGLTVVGGGPSTRPPDEPASLPSTRPPDEPASLRASPSTRPTLLWTRAEALAPLPVSVLGEFERIRLANPENRPATESPARAEHRTPSTEHRSSGWSHPRTTHPAQQTKRLRKRDQEALAQGVDHLRTLRRWGIHTLGDLAALPPPDVYERLGARGVAWQHLARGEDDGPLVPWVDEAPFEKTMDLEWPIEGLEPLSFVLARLLEPLVARLEQADRGAAVLHTSLRLTTKTTHVRSLQLPAPMRDPKTLRTLMLLDLETHPPDAAVDRVCVLIEPTPARVLQWTLYDRAEPAPEQVSTLLARLTALMGEGRVGSPQLVDTWRPGAFAIAAFQVQSSRFKVLNADRKALNFELGTLNCAVRRFRLPVPVRVKVEEGRPVRVTTDRHGVSGGAITQAAGPWRLSGDWWDRGWDRDEWDIAMADGTVYRLSVKREVGQWFLEGIVD